MTIEPLVRVRPMYARGMNITYATSTTLSISSGMCSDSTGSVDINVGSFTGTSGTAATLDFAKIGVINGLDKGAIAANKIYSIYAICDASGRSPAGYVASTSATNPSMPLGSMGGSYTHYRRIGYAITNNSAATLQILQQTGFECVRWYHYDTLPGASLSAGTGASSPSFASCPLITATGSYVVVPPVAGRVLLNCDVTAHAAAEYFALRTTGSADATGARFKSSAATAIQTIPVIIQTGLDTTPYQSVDWLCYAAASTTTLSLTVEAFEDCI